MQLDGTTPLWIAARGLLHERGDELFRRRDKVLRTLNPEDIHDLRVASRRLREGLALFAPCYPQEGIGRIDKKVRSITRLLGKMRNTDEAVLFFTMLADEVPDARSDLEPLLTSLRKERKKEERRLRNGLQKIAAGDVRDLYLRVINAPCLFTPPEDVPDLFAPISAFARESLASRLSVIRQLLPPAREEGAIDAQHRLRIAVKHFRYRMELLSFLFGTAYQQLHGAVKGYQDVLGKMHDLDVFAVMVRVAGLGPGAEKPILDAIITNRGKLFRDFSGMLKTTPLDELGAQVRVGA